MTGSPDDVIKAFAARYPRVWHVIEAEGGGCQTLYPAATLRRLAGLPLDNANRNNFQLLNLPEGARAILRLQLMPDARLRPTLAGVFAGQPDAWRDLINQHVFFWLSEDRRDRFAMACARFRARSATGPFAAPVALAIDTKELLSAHHHVAFFSRINSGSVVRGGARVRRDETTIRPLSAWRGERAVELAIRAPVHLAPRVGNPSQSHGPRPAFVGTNCQSSSPPTNWPSLSGDR